MDQLTKQENNIARYVAKGLLEKEIASELFIAESTVLTHKRNIRNKTGARNSVEITLLFLKSLNPKMVLPAMVFCVIQIGMIFTSTDFDVRKVRNARKVNRIVKVRRFENF